MKLIAHSHTSAFVLCGCRVHIFWVSHPNYGLCDIRETGPVARTCKLKSLSLTSPLSIKQCNNYLKIKCLISFKQVAKQKGSMLHSQYFISIHFRMCRSHLSKHMPDQKANCQASCMQFTSLKSRDVRSPGQECHSFL